MVALNFLLRVWYEWTGLPAKLTQGNPNFGLDHKNKTKTRTSKACLCHSKMESPEVIPGIISSISVLRRLSQLTPELVDLFFRRNAQKAPVL